MLAVHTISEKINRSTGGLVMKQNQEIHGKIRR
jgi:hypothetical protein